MKHIIAFSLIIALCWMTWVPSFAQVSEPPNDYYLNQIIAGTYMSMLGSIGSALVAAGIGYFTLPPIFGDCNRSCLSHKSDVAGTSGALGFLAGLAIGAVYGVSNATPEGIEGNWWGAMFGVAIGEIVGIGASFFLLAFTYEWGVSDQALIILQSIVVTALITSLGAAIGFNFGATTSD
jgi:hypothetical protein